MADRTTVWVYAVDDSGATGAQIGWATLVEPSFALVDRPTDDTPLVPPGPVRVAVMMAGGRWVELLDGTAKRIAGADDLILIDLGGGSFAPTVDVPLTLQEDPLDPGVFVEPTPAELIAGLREVLAAAPAPPELPAIEVQGLIERLHKLVRP